MKKKLNLINLMYTKMVGLFWVGLFFLILFSLANYVDLISPVMLDNEEIEFTLRGDVALFDQNWKPLAQGAVVAKDPIPGGTSMVLMKKYAFVRLDYTDFSEAFTLRNTTILLLSLASWWIWLVLIYQLKKILGSLRINKIFDLKNIKRIRIIGIVFLVFPLLVRAKNLLFSGAVADAISIPGYSIAQDEGFWIFPRIVSLNVVGGLLVMLFVFILAQVFAHGMYLKSENDLTI